MKVGITTRNVELDDDLRKQAERMAERLTRYFERIISADYTFERHKRGIGAEVVLKVTGKLIVAKAEAGDVRTSLDLLYEKAERQVKKYRDQVYRTAVRRKSSVRRIVQPATPPTEEE